MKPLNSLIRKGIPAQTSGAIEELRFSDEARPPGITLFYQSRLSGVGHSTTGYADKVAYDKVDREKCEGLEINGKGIGQ
ncbi:MAG: hypothetical protein EOP82_03630 [Variovorax sp.]|nr:MAG: hypothetical protein EOP82_03630 [Variovorax sp.]